MQIAIIGAGVIGATTALRLQECLSGDLVSITIFSEDFSPKTTGDVSICIYIPSKFLSGMTYFETQQMLY